MMKMEQGVKPYFEYIAEEVKDVKTIGVDPYQFPTGAFLNRQSYFKEKGLSLVTTEHNFVDLAWSTERPLMPQNKVFLHDTLYSGRTVEEKYKLVAEKLNKSVDYLLVTTLDDIAWLLNLRGTDI